MSIITPERFIKAIALIILFVIVGIAASAQTPKGKKHYKPSKAKVLKRQHVQGGTIELTKFESDTIVVNIDQNGNKKGQKVNWGKPFSRKMIYYSTAKDSAVIIDVPTEQIVCPDLPEPNRIEE